MAQRLVEYFWKVAGHFWLHWQNVDLMKSKLPFSKTMNEWNSLNSRVVNIKKNAL